MNKIYIYLKGSLYCPFLLLLLLASCSEPQWKQLEGEALGTTYSIQFLGSENAFTLEEMDSIMEFINHGLSTYQTNSLITAFNTNDNSMWEDREQLVYFESDMKHFMTMLNVSGMVYELSQGAFNPTAGKLFDYWTSVKQEQKGIDSALIASYKKHQGFDLIGKDPNGFPLKKDSAMVINFNAVAKGYAVDEVADFMESKGVERYLVEIGGEVRANGLSPENKAWRLGINRPVIGSETTALFEAVELEKGAMATSGNYRNYFVVEGDTLGHTVDPRTGYPVMNNLLSATVMHQYCAIADAFATACMVMGEADAKAMIESDSTLTAYFIVEKDGQLNGYFIN